MQCASWNKDTVSIWFYVSTCDVFTHYIQGIFFGYGAIILLLLPQFQGSNP